MKKRGIFGHQTPHHPHVFQAEELHIGREVGELRARNTVLSSERSVFGKIKGGGHKWNTLRMMMYIYINIIYIINRLYIYYINTHQHQVGALLFLAILSCFFFLAGNAKNKQ